MADNARQHVVPSFYISFFTEDGSNVYVRKAGADSIFLKPPSSQGYEIDAFTVWTDGQRDTSCDNANQILESWCAPRLSSLTGKTLPTDEQWQSIFIFTANLICRSRWTRDHHKSLAEPGLKVLPKIIDVLKAVPPLPRMFSQFGLQPTELDGLEASLKRAIDLQYPLIVALGTQAAAEELKTERDCDLLVPPCGSTFITSDDPVLVLNKGEAMTTQIQNGFLSNNNYEVYLPLKSDLACIWSSNSCRTIRTTTADMVAFCNGLVWKNCYERAFASRRSDLENP